MASLGLYTTTQAVRGCLGIDEEDCPDSFMLDSLLDQELVVDLDDWLPTHETLFAAGTVEGAEPAIRKRATLLTLYAQWFCAHQMALRPLTVPQIATDGKAQIDRFKVDLKRVAELAAQKVGEFKGKLQVAVDGTTQVAIGLPTSLLTVAVPAVDPVTEAVQ